MECYHPINIRSPNGFVKVPCGQCYACQSNRRKDFAFRLKEEMKHSICSYTVTLTYDDLHLPPLESFSDDPVKAYLESSGVCDLHSFYYHPYNIRHIQLFFKRLRKKFKFRYFGVAEYGSHSNRPHYHIIFFFRSILPKHSFIGEVVRCWDHGSQIVVDDTDDSCIEYTLKYCLKPKWIRQPRPQIFCSKQPFIGYDYFSWDKLKYHMHSSDDYTHQDGKKVRLPRIYRKIYTDNMKCENTKKAQINALESILKDEKVAAEQGLSYQEYRNRKIASHKERVTKQIKKKSL